MSMIKELYRNSFPKGLRFGKDCQILHAELYMLVKRNKHRKYIAKADIRDVLDGYEQFPGPPVLRLPVIRHVLLLRLVNAVRTYYGKRSWLISSPLLTEYTKVTRWMDAQDSAASAGKQWKTSTSVKGGGGGSSTAGYMGGAKRADAFVEREVFSKDVLGNFHVATAYHRVWRAGTILVALLLLLLWSSTNIEYLVYVYLRYYKGMSRKEIIAWFAEITEEHALTEVSPAYKGLIPPPCVRYSPPPTSEESGDCMILSITEFESEDGAVTVVAVPCPVMGEKAFFERIGTIARACDAVIMEGITMDRIHRIFPAVLLPLKGETFPPLSVSHRFIDVVRGKGEPPLLYPAGSRLSWRAKGSQYIIPFEYRCIYMPTKLFASKGEARNGWGRLRELIDAHRTTESSEGVSETQPSGNRESKKSEIVPYTICLPWSVSQITNLESSLLRYNFRVKNVTRVKWIDVNHLGESFCSYYGITE